MTAADGDLPRPRASRRRLAVRPILPEQRKALDDHDDSAAWFTCSMAEDVAAWSVALGALLGRPAGRATCDILLSHVHRDDQGAMLRAVARAWLQGKPVETTVRLVRVDGSWLDVDCRLEPVAGEGEASGRIGGTVRDVSARERTRREVARLVRRQETVQTPLIERDPATGLLTRARFADELDRARRRGGALLVVRVEPIDRSTARRPGLNAELLHRAARVCENLVRAGDDLGRVGPNEIGILLGGASWTVARRRADRFVEALRTHPFVLPDAWLHANAWAGLVRYRPDGEAGSHELLIDAEHAWRLGRAEDRSVTPVSQPVPVRDRKGSYRSRVTEALGGDRFTLFSQPILELQSNTVTRHELLLRVLDEAGGPQSPVQVLDSAERLDAIYDIDVWVLRNALQMAAEHGELRLQVNVSGRSIGDPRLTSEVEQLLQRHAVRPDQITFEITETALIGNLTEARRFTDRVREFGCQLALDDFGSGYASFRYLRLFPIDLVKIDGDYIVDLVHRPQNQVLVRALVEVCQAYGIHTVAEFVQDDATLRLLRDVGVDYAQGFLIGRPEPVAALTSGRALAPSQLRRR